MYGLVPRGIALSRMTVFPSGLKLRYRVSGSVVRKGSSLCNSFPVRAFLTLHQSLPCAFCSSPGALWCVDFLTVALQWMLLRLSESSTTAPSKHGERRTITVDEAAAGADATPYALPCVPAPPAAVAPVLDQTASLLDLPGGVVRGLPGTTAPAANLLERAAAGTCFQLPRASPAG